MFLCHLASVRHYAGMQGSKRQGPEMPHWASCLCSVSRSSLVGSWEEAQLWMQLLPGATGTWLLWPGSSLKCSCPPGSEAVAAGLCAGQCILKVNGNSVANDGALEVLEHFQAFRSRREEALVSTRQEAGGWAPSWRAP